MFQVPQHSQERAGHIHEQLVETSNNEQSKRCPSQGCMKECFQALLRRELPSVRFEVTPPVFGLRINQAPFTDKQINQLSF
jgi:hypothetical protein